MAAEPQLAPQPEAERPPAPAQEAAKPMTLNEALTGVPTPEAPPEPESLREKEDRSAREGMAKLNEMGKSLNLQAETGTREFEEKTKSWWDRAKGMFKKSEDASPVKGEQDVLKEIEKADAVYAEFKKKYEEVMASGDEAALRGMEGSLSKAYEQLAPQVAAEGAAESKQWKKALKTGEMPPITETGAKLNDVTRRLMEVRGKLNAGASAAGREASLKGGEVVAVDAGTRQKRDGTTEGVVTTTYADGRERVETESGRDLVSIPGGLAKGAEAPAEGSDENPILLTPEMRVASTEGVRSGETESKPEPSEPAQEESVVVSPEASASSSEAPAASGEIAVADSDIVETVPAPRPSPHDAYPNLPKPAPGSLPPGVPEAPPIETPAEKPEPAPEKKESAFDKLEAKLDDAAAEVMKMPEAAESPKTFPTKVGKLPADKFLEAFKAVGALSEGEAKDLAEQFRLDSEGFDALRKKLSLAVRKKMKG